MFLHSVFIQGIDTHAFYVRRSHFCVALTRNKKAFSKGFFCRSCRSNCFTPFFKEWDQKMQKFWKIKGSAPFRCLISRRVTSLPSKDLESSLNFVSPRSWLVCQGTLVHSWMKACSSLKVEGREIICSVSRETSVRFRSRAFSWFLVFMKWLKICYSKFTGNYPAII